jgi:hypothetical protein
MQVYSITVHILHILHVLDILGTYCISSSLYIIPSSPPPSFPTFAHQQTHSPSSLSSSAPLRSPSSLLIRNSTQVNLSPSIIIIVSTFLSSSSSIIGHGVVVEELILLPLESLLRRGGERRSLPALLLACSCSPRLENFQPPPQYSRVPEQPSSQTKPNPTQNHSTFHLSFTFHHSLPFLSSHSNLILHIHPTNNFHSPSRSTTTSSSGTRNPSLQKNVFLLLTALQLHFLSTSSHQTCRRSPADFLLLNNGSINNSNPLADCLQHSSFESGPLLSLSYRCPFSPSSLRWHTSAESIPSSSPDSQGSRVSLASFFFVCPIVPHHYHRHIIIIALLDNEVVRPFQSHQFFCGIITG